MSKPQADRATVERSLGRRAGSALRVHRALQERPAARAGALVERTRPSAPAVNNSLRALEDLGIIREVTGRRRNRVFSYTEYVRILGEGTQMPPTPRS